MEKANTVSRSVIQQRTVEQIVGFPVAKVCRKMTVQLVEVPQNVPRDIFRQRADERIHDTPVLKVLEELVEKGILVRIVEQIADVLPWMEERLVEVPKTVFRDKIQQRVGEQIVDMPVLKVVEKLMEVFRDFPRSASRTVS